MGINEALSRTGFVICEFPPDEDPCDSCGKKNKQLYYLRTCCEYDEGDYFCADCVVKRAEKSERVVGIKCIQCSGEYLGWEDQEPGTCFDCYANIQVALI